MRDIVIGRRRGQAQRLVLRQEAETVAPKKVRVDLRVSLRARAILHRLGGGKWIETVAALIDAELRRARTDDPNAAFARVLKQIGGVK